MNLLPACRPAGTGLLPLLVFFRTGGCFSDHAAIILFWHGMLIGVIGSFCGTIAQASGLAQRYFAAVGQIEVNIVVGFFDLAAVELVHGITGTLVFAAREA